MYAPPQFEEKKPLKNIFSRLMNNVIKNKEILTDTLYRVVLLKTKLKEKDETIEQLNCTTKIAMDIAKHKSQELTIQLEKTVDLYLKLVNQSNKILRLKARLRNQEPNQRLKRSNSF